MMTTEKRRVGRPKIEGGTESISVSLSRDTLEKLNALAKEKNISRHALVVSLILKAVA